jgi:acetyl-CoA C-acetyltransferase
VAALAAGLGERVPGLTIDQQCGSGLAAVGQAAALIGSGAATRVLAGGAESASTAPLRFWPAGRSGAEPVRYTRAPFAPAGFPDPSMGAAADALALRLDISRAEQDRYAERSHSLAHAAETGGTFDDEIVTVAGVSRDQRPRPGMTTQRLARLPAAFTAGGTATAGNSCGISDGAAVLTMVADRPGSASGLAIRGVATVGCDPALPGLGAAAAIDKVLSDTGCAARDVGAVEITEAFATVALATIRLAGLDEEIVCSDGGAIGYGHPWGASGAVLLVRLFSRMVCADGPALGLAACAIGGGLGIALLVERTG